MTTFVLKIFACICMVLDHSGEYLGMPVFFRYIGRCAAPVFTFCCVQGFLHTSNRKKYMQRLYVAGVLMSFFDVMTNMPVNFFRPLFSVCLILYVIEYYRKARKMTVWVLYFLWQILTIFTCYLIGYTAGDYNPTPFDLQGVAVYTLSAVFGNILFLEGGILFLAFGIVFYLCREDKKQLLIWFLLTVFIFTALRSSWTLQNLYPHIFYSMGAPGDAVFEVVDVIVNDICALGSYYYQPITENYQWMMCFSIVPILCYNGRPGKKVKWFFYLFYPVHYVLFYLIGTFF